MPHTFVILGASGDLTHRKLVPALYHLFRKGRLPRDTRIVGFSRTRVHARRLAGRSGESRGPLSSATTSTPPCGITSPLTSTTTPAISAKAEDFATLAKLLNEIEKSPASTRVYYLATAPQFYEQAVEQLGHAGLADENGGQRRVIIEKPFGTDLASAKNLNQAVHAVFSERQVYRIDHYLGKETVQNLLVLRFANTIFEPIWNRNYIDHVQITVAEEVDVGRRAGYYDSAGVMRDMFQNHLLQLVMITAMEAPVRYEADAVRNEKVKVLQAIRPLHARRRAPRHAPRPVSRLRRRRRRPPRQPHRHVRRHQALDRQLALAGRAVLLAKRQSDVLPHHANRRPIPRTAAHALSGRPQKHDRLESARHPSAAGRGHSVGVRNESSRRRHANSARPLSTSATAASSAA